MKKTLSMLLGLSLAVSAFGADSLSELTLSISTEGPDVYADGTPVLVGETYLLVYVKAGAAFAGVQTDGALVDPVNNVKVTTSQAIEGAKCGFKAIQYPATLFPAGGSWVIVLLDTRTADGTLGGLVAGHSAAVPAAKRTATSGLGLGTVRAAAASGSGLTSSAVPPAPTDTPAPVISAIEPKGTAVGLRIKNFTDKASYEVQTCTDLASGAWQQAKGGARLQALGRPTGPSAELPATLTVPADDTVRYFRVIVPGGK